MTPEDLVSINSLFSAFGLLALGAFCIGVGLGVSLGLTLSDRIDRQIEHFAGKRARLARNRARFAQAGGPTK